MIVVYTHDGTYNRKDADAAKDLLVSVYGKKIGTEAFTTVKDAWIGDSYRKHGDPLVRVVSEEQATEIRKKEIAAGMM